MPTIAVEIPAMTASTEQADALLRACNIAAAPDRCERAERTSETPSAFAVVTWQGELAVHVEVGHPGAEDWLERRITFAPEDPPLERWQAVGFTIGTLFGASSKTGEPAAATSPPPAQENEKQAPDPAPLQAQRRPERHAFHTALLARVGSGTESSARFGAGLQLAARHAEGPFLSTDVNFDLADVAVGPPAAALSGRFVTAGMSLGTGVALGPKLRLDLSAGPILEYQWLWTDQATVAQSRVIGGARGNVTLAHRFSSRTWIGVGAQLGSRFGDTAITIDGERVDSIPLLFATAALSLGFDVWQARE